MLVAVHIAESVRVERLLCSRSRWSARARAIFFELGQLGCIVQLVLLEWASSCHQLTLELKLTMDKGLVIKFFDSTTDIRAPRAGARTWS